MAYTIDIINQCCIDLGGTGGHYYEDEALAEICTILGATPTGTRNIDYLNAICTVLSYTSDWQYDIDALNTIVVGGTYEYEDEAWADIQVGSLLNQVPDGIYLVDEEIVFLCEEDNTEILLIEETEV